MDNRLNNRKTIKGQQKNIYKEELKKSKEDKRKREIKYDRFEKLIYQDFTEEEKSYFRKETPEVRVEDLIKAMGRWLESKGKSYKDYYSALQDWAHREQKSLGPFITKPEKKCI